jgi:hypothetical protein
MNTTTAEVPYTLIEPERTYHEYLCEGCNDLWGRLEATLSSHGDLCTLKVKNATVDSRYCMCEVEKLLPYVGRRLKSRLNSAMCPVCAVIWASADLLRGHRLRTQSMEGVHEGSNLTCLQIRVYFQPAYARSRIEIDGLGELQFRLYEMDFAYQRWMPVCAADEGQANKARAVDCIPSWC